MFRGGDVVELDEHVSLGSSAYLCRFKTYEKRVEPLPHSFVDGWHMSLFGWIATDWEKKQLWRQYNKLPQGRRCKSLHRKEAAHSVTVADCRIQRGWRRAMRFISFHIISSFHLFQAFCCIAFSLPSGDPPGGNTRSISAISATALKPGTTTNLGRGSKMVKATVPSVWFSPVHLRYIWEKILKKLTYLCQRCQGCCAKCLPQNFSISSFSNLRGIFDVRLFQACFKSLVRFRDKNR